MRSSNISRKKSIGLRPSMFGMMPGVAVKSGALDVVVDVALLAVVSSNVGGALVLGLCIGEREGLLVSTCIGEEGLPGGDCCSGSVFSDSRERERAAEGAEPFSLSLTTLWRNIVGPSSLASQPSNSSSLSNSSMSSIRESSMLGSDDNVRWAIVARKLLCKMYGKRNKVSSSNSSQ